MSKFLPQGIKEFSVNDSLNRRIFVSKVAALLEFAGYKYLEIPIIMPKEMFISCTEGTENKMFDVNDGCVLIPEVTNYIKQMGFQRIGSRKIYYIARCFRLENTTDKDRLREFTQIGVEILDDNSLDARKIVRRDAIELFSRLLKSEDWTLEDNVKRGLNLYNSDKTFEITSSKAKKQLLGGGPYDGGAGWALGLERVMNLLGELDGK